MKLERDVVSMLLLLNTKDDYTYQHSVQVGMLSYYIAKWLDYDEHTALRIGKAGFLHDIGKSKIDLNILNKPGKLTEEEFEQIKQHPLFGYEIINNSFRDDLIALAALQHHERMNGTGYPNGMSGERIHPAAKIVAVADIYSAMISTRVYREKRDLMFVLKELHRMSFHDMDPLTTHTFIRHMVPNFIGKTVELQSGAKGIIVMTNTSDFFRPLVRVNDKFVDLSSDHSDEIKAVFM
ncbi:HD-GYP domain-containing protein [Paenibacillus tarimensis]